MTIEPGTSTGRTQEEVMHKLFGDDVLPYFAGQSGETQKGLAYEYWSIEGALGQESWGQTYLIQDYNRSKGGYFWISCDGEPEAYESNETDLEEENEEEEENV